MMESTDHLSEHSLAAFVDGRLARDERRRAEAHLADCAACREDVIAVTDLTRPRKRIRLPVIPLAAAAAVALIAIGVFNRSDPPDQPLLRGEAAQPAIVASMPSTGTFTWQPVERALEYRLTLMNDAGDVVAERVTSGTTTTVDSMPPASYKWYVTAILENGAVLSSRVQSFRVR